MILGKGSPSKLGNLAQNTDPLECPEAKAPMDLRAVHHVVL